MELLALVIINLLFSVILYYGVSIKVTNTLRDQQSKKLSSDINKHLLSIYKETENYMALLDSRIAILSNLLAKAESKGISLKDTEYNALTMEGHLSKEEKRKMQTETDDPRYKPEQTPPVVLRTGIKAMYIKNEIQNMRYVKLKDADLTPVREGSPESFFSDFIIGIGKGVKSILGMDSFTDIARADPPSAKSSPTVARHLDFSVGGDPLSDPESTNLTDHAREEPPFRRILRSMQNPELAYSEKMKDKVIIAPEAALAELSEGATRVERVVHLLKKNYSHAQIAEALGLAVPEVSLIETIKIEKARRI